MSRIFGTDGVRGLANRDVTPELALGLGVAAARVLSSHRDGAVGSDPHAHPHRPRAVIGRDGRASGEFLSAALVAGLASAGVDVVDLGLLPTPAIAYLTALRDTDLGVVVSASHNPMADNGIKFLSRGGHKLPDDLEDEITELLHAEWDRPVGPAVGRYSRDSGRAADDYVDHLLGTIDADLSGLRIALDCANGAASEVGPRALREAGADVVVINASPDGRNINEKCGSTHPEQLQATVVASEADLGFAFDGDADRCLAVDATGRLVDGDQLMGLMARALKREGRLVKDTLVVTVMSNLGLLLAMRDDGIVTEQTGVGDRYVLERMREGGFILGGEQSGHIILSDHATTGDGVLTALQVSAQVATQGPLAELVSFVKRLPQVLVNVSGVDRTRAATDEALADAVRAAEAELGETGRVLLRPSGTEPLVRVMVEADTSERASTTAERLAEVVRERLSL
ncbi:MAG: phosphoglucosamine mutase [Salana multivorans]|uniref:phosphoglucosamine mutase n=1 Tax=Salana multivorans TaxID=120377 RepID=UPI00095C25E6|nr:phosphoglucosamine mutase [Salana multivorans]MBN8883451.1 phosphoglucosamine mutase [Salana multivorans]OJX97781.1 MAG: phosphoglucosamine mutase [Micrococcales bacterium 73-15]